jgi:hypothetical protein
VSYFQQVKRGFALDAPGRKQKTVQILSDEALIGGLVSEMTRLLSTTETRRLSPPFKVVILDNCGCIAFMGEVSRDGTVLPLGHFLKLRRSSFPENALLTDSSLCTRSFRLDLGATKNTYR